MVVEGRANASPVVMVPGIQGRWEWMEPAVRAVALRHRVVTGSLAGELHSRPFDPARGFDNYVEQLDSWYEGADFDRAAVCGVSYGGLIAVRYAALRPEKVTSLILVSTPGARWQPDSMVHNYMRAPRLLAPLFVARAPGRILPEVLRSQPTPWRAAAFSARHLTRIVLAPMSPARMAERGRLIGSVDFVADARRVSAPTLIVTGEPGLDRVVPVESTRSYLDLIPLARAEVLARTGHIGLVSRPEAFADIVSSFVEQNDGRPPVTERKHAG